MMSKPKLKVKNVMGSSSFGATTKTTTKTIAPYERGTSMDSWKDGYSNSYSTGAKCHHSHPAMKLGDYTIYGGSCITPSVLDAEVYVGFDGGMTFRKEFYPWDGKQQLLYRITDMDVPQDLTNFKQMLAFVWEALEQGKKVHLGCIGGHGRTGLVLSALVSVMMPEVEDAIGYVRANYCIKAVESNKQVEWLVKHFGVKPVAGYKETPAYKASIAPLPKVKTTETGQKAMGFAPPQPHRAQSGFVGAPVGSPKASTKYAISGEIVAMAGPESIWFEITPLTPTIVRVT